MGRKIPRTDDEVYALREYEVELSEDEITPIPTRKQNSGRRQMVAPAGGAKRELEVKRRSCCCRVMRGGLITLLVVINVFVLLLVLDEYYRIEVCFASSPRGDSRLCHVLGLKNMTMEAAEIGMEEWEKVKPYILNYTSEAGELTSSVLAEIQEKISESAQS